MAQILGGGEDWVTQPIGPTCKTPAFCIDPDIKTARFNFNPNRTRVPTCTFDQPHPHASAETMDPEPSPDPDPDPDPMAYE